MVTGTECGRRWDQTYKLGRSCGTIWRQEKHCTLNVEKANTLIRGEGMMRDFSHGPVVKIPHFQPRGCRFNPWLENWDPTCHEVQPKKKKAWWTYTPKENDGRSLFNMEGSDWAEQKKIEVVIKRETINISFKLGPLMKWKGILCNCFPGTKCVKWDLSWANRGILFSRYYSVLAWSSFIDYKNRKY